MGRVGPKARQCASCAAEMCIPKADSAPARAACSTRIRGAASGAWPGSCTDTDTTLPKGGTLNGKNTSVIGIYPDRTTVSDAINVLHKAGYRTTDISVLSSDNQGSKDFAHDKAQQGLGGRGGGSGSGRGGWRRIGLVRFHSGCDHRGFRAAGRGWTGAGCFGWRRRGGALGWIVGLLAGPAADRIRRQAVRGQNQAWRHSRIRSLRQPGVV
jgi:hypothetical protein